MIPRKPTVVLYAAFCLMMLMVAPLHAAQVQLSWTAPTKNADGTALQDLAGYKIYYGVAPLTYGAPIDVGNTTTYPLSGLTGNRQYYAAVTAYDASGNESVYSQELPFITPSDTSTTPAPVASFTASPTSGIAPLTVSFTNTSTGNVTSWLWDFGDGSTSTTQTPPAHTYASPPSNPTTYTVRLTATGPGGTNATTRAITVSQSTTPPLSGLVAAYSFNEGTDTTVYDSSGNGNNGTISGATWTTGKYGSALSFNGSTSYVNLQNPASLQLSGSMTISGWIYSTSFPVDDAVVVSKRESINKGYQLDTTIDSGPRTIGFKISDASNNVVARYGASTLSTNTWYHMAGVYDASNRSMNVYLNGTLNNGTLVGIVPSSQPNSSQNVNIGRRPGLSGFSFSGKIDDVRIYNRALSMSEIQADMGRGVGATTSGIGMASSNRSPAKLGQMLATLSQATSAPGSAASVNQTRTNDAPSSNGSSPQTTTSETLTSARLDTGEATVDQQWQHVAFKKAFLEPVVVAKALSYRDVTPVHVQMQPSDPNGFAVRLQPQETTQGTHAPEALGYLVMERGRYSLPQGTQVESDSVEVAPAQPAIAVSFSQPFRKTPVVVTAMSGLPEADMMTGGLMQVSTTGFQFQLQQPAPGAIDNNPVTISYIAWEPSVGSVDGFTFEVNTTGPVSRDQFQTIQFREAFADAPVFLADSQSTIGSGPLTLRWSQKDGFGIDVKLEEEPSRAATADQGGTVVGYFSLR